MKEENAVGHKITHLEDKIAMLEKKLADKSCEVDSLKERFLSNISHEIRTPMNAIVGFSSLLNDPLLNEKEREVFLDGILKSSDNLLKIIDNLIQTARLEAKDVQIYSQQVDVDGLMHEILEKFQKEKCNTGKSHIDIRLLKSPGRKKLIINTDPVKLKYILCNLLENALKFTDKGFIELGYKPSGNSIEFFVKDSGIGIPSKKLSMVFDKFTQVDDSPRKSHNGIGVGLSISKSLTEILGGKLNVTSTPGNGSTFTITLPIKMTKEEQLSDLFINRRSSTWPAQSKGSFNQIINNWKRNISVHSKNLNIF